MKNVKHSFCTGSKIREKKKYICNSLSPGFNNTFTVVVPAPVNAVFNIPIVSFTGVVDTSVLIRSVW